MKLEDAMKWALPDASHAKLKRATKTVADSIKIALVEDNIEVVIPGIGTLSTVEVEARDYRNPATGETVHVPAHRRVKFKANASLNRALR